MVENSDIFKILDMNIIDLDLREDVCDKMLDYNIKTVEDVVSYTEEEMLNIVGVKEYLDILQEKLTLLGLNFKYKVTEHKGIEGAIECLDLSVKTYNILKRAGITTVADLVHADIRKVRCLRNMGRSSYEEILLKLDEIGVNPINVEIEKVEKLQESLEMEKSQDVTSIASIEIKNMEVNKYCQLAITFTNPQQEEWIEIFNQVRTQYFSNKCDSVESIYFEPKIIAKKLICEIRLSASTITSCCSAKDIMVHKNPKDILVFFIEYLNDILQLTQEEYVKSVREASIKLKQLEIDEALKNIEFMKNVFAERDKIEAINNEIRNLLPL